LIRQEKSAGTGFYQVPGSHFQAGTKKTYHMIFQPDIECMDPGKLRELQDARLRKLVAYVFEHVPFYREKLQEKGIGPDSIRGIEDLGKLPITRKDDLRTHYPFGLFAIPLEQVVRIHASSGTTGKPTVVGYNRNDISTFAEVNARSLAAAGGKPGMILHNAYGYGLFTGGLGLHYGGERLGMAVLPISGGMTDRQIRLITDFRPGLICATPSYAQTLANEFEKRGITPDQISLEYAVLGAEPWTEAIREEVEKGLGLTALNIYGLSEIIGPGVSQECLEAKHGSHIWEDHFYPEIIDPETGDALPDGETGVLVFTTLTKEAMPLLRYWTNDLTWLSREKCVCGRTHVRMGPILGRTDDMLIIRGVNVYPTQIEEVIRSIPELIPHYQLVVTREGLMDEMEVAVELDPVFSASKGFNDIGVKDVESNDLLSGIRRQLVKKMKDNVGITVKATLSPPYSLPRSEGGKLKRTLDKRDLS
jgi:phenylacetate-CoA ligase